VTYLGVDIGGSVADLILMDEVGTTTTARALVNPDGLEKGILDAIDLVPNDRAVVAQSRLKQFTSFGHHTSPRALIERTRAGSESIASLRRRTQSIRDSEP
jgi:N-methylhydantoinase A/oxoprolinase/acetone carboxylase beta subunit